MTAARPLAEHPVFARGILQGFQLLEADAGTGKTWTLSGLVARALIERGIPIDRILVVTFTNAATAELGKRIRQRIEQLATLLRDRLEGRASAIDELFCVEYARTVEDPKRALDALRVALAGIDEAPIRTIHGLCQRVIDEHALSVGVPAGLRAEASGTQWAERMAGDWWRANMVGAGGDEIAFAAAAGAAPGKVGEALLKIAGQPGFSLRAHPGDWREHARAFASLRAQLASALRDEGDAFAAWIASTPGVNRRSFNARNVTRWRERLAGFASAPAGPGAALPDEIAHFATAKFAGADGAAPVPPFAIVPLCDALVELGPALDGAAGAMALEAWKQGSAQRLAMRVAEGSIGFEDLLGVVRDALRDPHAGPALAASLRERYPLALIDECQDTDSLQWEIFERIYPVRAPAREADWGLVLVGDPKQAIYAFRGADVYSYLGARDAARDRHALDENQRSVAPMIEAVNALFSRDRPFLVDEIGFAPTREGTKPRSRFEAPGAPARAALTAIELDPPAEGKMLRARDARRASLAAAVGEIARLLRPGAASIDGRPLHASDVAVLVNTHVEGSLVKRALAQAGIGAAEISRASVFESVQCDELVALLAAVADPASPELLRAALATTIGGFDAARLDALAGDERAWSRQVEAFAAAQLAWGRGGPQAALRPLLLHLGAGPRLAALRDGDRRLTNLMHLLELLAGAQEARAGPRQALAWLMRARSGDEDLLTEAGELRLESDEDLVRIVTVHKSKGLEYPIVFLPFAWAGKEPAKKRPLRLHERAPDGPGWAGVLDLRGELPEEDRLQAALEESSERLRTLYVALTRSEHRCYLCWGAAAGAQFAPLAWLLHGLDPSLQSEWRSNSTEPPALDGARAAQGLRDWAERANARLPGSVGVAAADELARGAAAERAAGDAAQGAGAGPDRDAGPVELGARPFEGRIAAPWVHASFTSLAEALARGEREAREGAPAFSPERPDHDQGALPAARAEGGPVRFSFPAGAQAGVCLHGILEHADLRGRPDPALARHWLGRCGFDAGLAPDVCDWLGEVLATELRAPGGEILRLDRVDPARAVREMEFLLPARGVDTRAVIAAVSREHPLRAEAAARRWSGWLKGFVDLAFEHEGRWWLLDWKSNLLGGTLADYGADAIERAIDEHAYALQYSLYTLALHRLLRARLPGYDYERHFGGVFYLFLRGVAPGSVDAGGQPTGVHAARPSAGLVRALDEAFGGKR